MLSLRVTLARLLELSRRLARELDLPPEKARLFLKCLVEEMTRGLKEDGNVSLRGFGRFQVKRNRQGVRIIFRPGMRLRSKLNR